MTNDLSPQTFRRLVVLAAVIVIGLPASIGIYSTSYNIPAYVNPNANATIDNPEVLQDILPQTIINIITQRVLSEATNNNNTIALPYHLKSAVTELDGDYDFTLVPSNSSGNLSVQVRVDDNFGLLSVTTTFGTATTSSTD